MPEGPYLLELELGCEQTLLSEHVESPAAAAGPTLLPAASQGKLGQQGDVLLSNLPAPAPSLPVALGPVLTLGPQQPGHSPRVVPRMPTAQPGRIPPHADLSHRRRQLGVWRADRLEADTDTNTHSNAIQFNSADTRRHC